MNFDNLMHYDLMTRRNQLFHFFKKFSSDFNWITALRTLVSGGISTAAIEAVSAVRRKQSLKVMTYVKRKTRSKARTNLKEQ